MTNTDASRSYREAVIRTADSVQCTIMLYDIVVEDLRRACACLSNGDIEGRTNAVGHCLSALEQLQGTLQMESGGEAAEHLNRFYSLARAKVLEGQIRCSNKLFEEIVAAVLQVRDLWLQVKRSAAPAEGGVEAAQSWAPIPADHDAVAHSTWSA